LGGRDNRHAQAGSYRFDLIAFHVYASARLADSPHGPDDWDAVLHVTQADGENWMPVARPTFEIYDVSFGLQDPQNLRFQTGGGNGNGLMTTLPGILNPD